MKKYLVVINILLILTMSAPVKSSSYRDTETEVIVDGHVVQILAPESSSVRWLKFPDQMALHRESVQSKQKVEGGSNVILSDPSFWSKYGNLVGFDEAVHKVILSLQYSFNTS